MEPTYKACLNPWVKPPQSRLQVIASILDSLAFPPNQESHPDPEPFQDLATSLRRLVAGEFFRIEFDSRFGAWKPRRGRGSGYQGTQVLVPAEAQLWSKTWQVLEQLQLLGRLPRLPDAPPVATFGTQNLTPFWLYGLVLESEFLMPYFTWPSEGKSEGARANIAIKQRENALLQALEENPFVGTYTKLFIDSAMSAANQCDPFRKSFYTPMVKQRMSVIAGLKNRNARIIDHDGRCARQGRKKKIDK